MKHRISHPASVITNQGSSANAMKILTAEFIKSCRSSEQFPADGLDEIAFAGRSNVGKSSLINSLLYRKSLAKISRTPGKTQAVNFFLVATVPASRLYFVDLPGYGYAKVAKSLREEWGPLIEGYLAKRSTLRGVILLVESRVIGPRDAMTAQWLQAVGCPTIVALTKVDKLRTNERHGHLERMRTNLNLPEKVPIIHYSSETHEGRDGLWGAIRGRLKT